MLWIYMLITEVFYVNIGFLHFEKKGLRWIKDGEPFKMRKLTWSLSVCQKLTSLFLKTGVQARALLAIRGLGWSCGEDPLTSALRNG